MALTVFKYRYRDAGNFKVEGTVVLDGSVSSAEEQEAIGCFQDQELFVAEQIGVPPLYADLYRWSGGPTADDHCWHEFVGFEAASIATVPLGAVHLGKARTFVNRITSVGEWNCALSPHAFLPAAG